MKLSGCGSYRKETCENDEHKLQYKVCVKQT